MIKVFVPSVFRFQKIYDADQFLNEHMVQESMTIWTLKESLNLDYLKQVLNKHNINYRFK